jgi:2,5-furandicarboxylate decarboxylase 1
MGHRHSRAGRSRRDDRVERAGKAARSEPAARLRRGADRREYYERITYAYADRAKIDDYVGGKKDAAGEAGDKAAVAALGAEILQVIAKEPLYFTDIAEKFARYDFVTIARAIGRLHATEKLWQDPRGRLCVRGSEFAAKPPQK